MYTLLVFLKLKCTVIYRIRGLFGGDFNLAVWRISIGSPNLNHAVSTHTYTKCINLSPISPN